MAGGARARNRVWWVVAYVAAVLLIDALAANNIRWHLDAGAFHPVIHWNVFTWRGSGPLEQFDFFKFLFWLVIPVTLCARRMEWAYFGFARWKRTDIYLFFALAVTGLLCVFAILFIPQLREWYPSGSGLAWSEKRILLYRQTVWNISWLPGWEFLHRYFLLRPLADRWPRWGWVVVPIAEALYHLQKDPLEMAAMFAAGIAFTLWARARRNLLLPFLVHATVEAGLAAFQVLY